MSPRPRAAGSLAITALLASALAGCGGGSDSSVHATASGYTVEVGLAQKGPLQRGAWVSVNELDPRSLQPVGTSFDFQIVDDTGRFNPAATVFTRRYVQSTALGYYFDEITGRISSDFAILRGLNDLDADRALNINVLTDLAHERTRALATRASNPYPFASARATAQGEVLRAFHIHNRADLMPGGAAGPAGFGELDLGQSRPADQILAALSAVIVQAGGSAGGSIGQVANRFEADLADDGALNNSPGFATSVRSQLDSAARSVDWSRVATHLNTFYRTTAYTAVNLKQWVDSSGGVDQVIDRFKFADSGVPVGAQSRSPEYVAGTDDAGRCFSVSAGQLYRNGVAVAGTVKAVKGDRLVVGLTAGAAGQTGAAFLQRSTAPASGVCPTTVPTSGLTRTMKYSVTALGQARATRVASGFSWPQGLAIDAAGAIYLADAPNNVVYKLTAQGSKTVFASVDSPSMLAFGPDGQLYVSQYNRGSVVRISPTGVVSPFSTGYTNTQGLAFDGAGQLFVVNSWNTRISRVGATGGSAAAFATLATRYNVGMAMGRDGHLYVAGNDGGSGSISRVSPTGSVSVFAALPEKPNGAAFDASGNLYVAACETIRVVTPTGAVSALPVDTPIGCAWGLAFDASGSLYVSDAGQDVLYRLQWR